MSSQSSSSITGHLLVSKRNISREASRKQLRRRRRHQGPPDRLSWLGDARYHDSAARDQSERNTKNELMEASKSTKRSDRESFSSGDDEHFLSSSSNPPPGKKIPLKSVDNNAIDLTFDSDDDGANHRFRFQQSRCETNGKSNNKLRDDADNGDGNLSMESSWQCRLCTLFNPSDQIVCDACGARRQPKRHASSTGKRRTVAKSREKSFTTKNAFIDSDNESGNILGNRSIKKKSKPTISINESALKNATKSIDLKSAMSSSLSKNNCSIHSRRHSSYSTTQFNPAETTSGKENASVASTSSELWINKHAPQNSKELCVAPKKVQEVREWLSSYASLWKSRRNSTAKNGTVFQNYYDPPSDMQKFHTEATMMILVGSPGIGKSTLALTLAKELNLEVLTWNDSQIEFVGNRWDRDIAIPYQSQLASFQEFLNSGGIGMDSLEVASVRPEYNTSLENDRTEQPNGSLILIEDIPNLHNAVSANAFRGMMESHIRRTSVPTIFVFSDVLEGKHKPDDLERLIPPHILYSRLVKILPIQPVTKSKMKKCLDSIAKIEKLDPLSSETANEIHLSSRGDLRHAIFNIQFQYGALKKAAKSCKSPTNSGGTSKRDVKLSSFHALGKLLYAKRLPRLNPPTWVRNPCIRNWDDGRGDLEFIPEKVLESTDMAIGSALSFVSFHSPDFFTDVSDLSNAFDRLSDAGTFLDSFVGQCQSDGPFPLDYASCIGGRAVANANKNPAPHQFRHFSTPKVFDVLRKQRENELKMDQLRKRLSTAGQHISVHGMIGSANQFVTDCLPHMRCILPHEVEYALFNLHSYANSAVDTSSESLPQKMVPDQNEVLLEDDLVDDDSL